MDRLVRPAPGILDRGHPHRAGRVFPDREPRAAPWFPRRPFLANRFDRDRPADPGSPPLGSRMPRNRGLILPLILIGIGVVVLLANTGVLSRQAVERLGDLWPLLLVILGLQLILNHTLHRLQATLFGLAGAAVVERDAVACDIVAAAALVGRQQDDARPLKFDLT